MTYLINDQSVNKDSLYRVTYHNGQEVQMTGPCLLNCHLKSIDESVAAYEEIFCYVDYPDRAWDLPWEL